MRAAIKRIEISHARSKQRDGFPTEEEHAVTRSELGRLMRLARIARPGAIYDASAAARNFAHVKPGKYNDADISEGNGKGCEIGNS